MSDNHKLFADKLKAAIRREGISQRQALERLQEAAEKLSEQYGDGKYTGCLEVSYDTFKKMLQGQYLEKRLYVLAEIANYAFATEGVAEEDYTDPKVGLADFMRGLGLNPDEDLAPDKNAAGVRQVRKVLFLLKARSVNNTPLLLNYFSADWQTLLVPNANIPGKDNAETVLTDLLAERLGISPGIIGLDYQPGNKKRYSETLKKTGSEEKARKYGPWANYTFLYCPVKLNETPAFMLQSPFKARDVEYHWATLNGLKTDGTIRTLNDDVLEYLSRVYDATLFHLPVSFQDRIEAEM